jgi:hypothetical protein
VALVVELIVVLVVEGVVEVEEAGVVDDVDTDVLDDCTTEPLVLVVELAGPAELVDVEVGVVVPPDDGAEAK